MPNSEYFAGHFDGEGCLYMSRHNAGWRLKATVSACHKPVLEYYKTTFGGSIREVTRGAKNKTLWCWSLTNHAELLVFLQSIAPFSLEKKPQILIGCEWLLARKAFPRYRVPHTFIELGNQCAAELAQLKKL